MADPLSISASILAVVGATVTTARAIEKCKEYKRLPTEFKSLLEEVAELLKVLEQCGLLHSRKQGGENGFQDGDQHKRSQELLGAVQAAQHKLSELQTLISPNAATELDYRMLGTLLVHGKKRVSRFREELRDIRLGLSSSLEMLTTYVLAMT